MGFAPGTKIKINPGPYTPDRIGIIKELAFYWLFENGSVILRAWHP
jgi:hypothetical protein